MKYGVQSRTLKSYRIQREFYYLWERSYYNDQRVFLVLGIKKTVLEVCSNENMLENA